MPYPLPPWLEGNPSQFVPEQYGRGVQLGISERGEAAQEQAEQQRLAIAQQTAQRDQQQLQVQNAINQQKLQMSLDAAKRKYQAQQTYQQMVASGADPTEAMLKIGPLLGENGTTMAAAVRNQQMAKRASLPPTILPIGENGSVGTAVDWGGTKHFFPARVPNSEQDFGKQEQNAVAVLQKEAQGIQKILADPMTQAAAKSNPKLISDNEGRLKKIQAKLAEINPLLEIDEDPTVPPPSDSTGKSGIKVLSIQQVN